jgi:putative transposase
MARKRREWNPHMFYHIVSRGNRRDALFLDTRDFKTFLFILSKTNQIYPFQLPSYCLMTNHYHLLLKSPLSSISTVMAIINKRYASYYNNRYRLTGHVFEDRFFSEPIVNIQGMLEVCRYIHMNPVVANMVLTPEDYEWSSSPFYHTRKSYSPTFFHSEPILSIFSGPDKEKRRKYTEYMGIERDEKRKDYLLLELLSAAR